MRRPTNRNLITRNGGEFNARRDDSLSTIFLSRRAVYSPAPWVPGRGWRMMRPSIKHPHQHQRVEKLKRQTNLVEIFRGSEQHVASQDADGAVVFHSCIFNPQKSSAPQFAFSFVFHRTCKAEAVQCTAQFHHSKGKSGADDALQKLANDSETMPRGRPEHIETHLRSRVCSASSSFSTLLGGLALVCG